MLRLVIIYIVINSTHLMYSSTYA